MESWVRAVVEAIHSSRAQAVIYLAGGASQALGWLLSVPGASGTVLEVVVPYSRASMAQLLGKMPLQFTSKQAAEDMALAAFNRALKLSGPGLQVMGVGFTGSLASSRPKHGSMCQHERKIASGHHMLRCQRVYGAERKKIRFQATFCSRQSWTAAEFLQPFSQMFKNLNFQKKAWNNLMKTKNSSKLLMDSMEKNFNRKIILPGSFNPLHDGHLRLLEVASSMCDDGLPCFEISAINADKPPLSIAEIKRRVEQFRKVGKNVIISNQPYFYKKAELFPGSAFVIGADTAARLVNPKYYGGDYNRMLEILLECKNTGTTFLVGGRNIEGVFKVLEDLDIPGELRDMFISIPEEKFRMDISSTDLRKKQGP